MGIQEKESNSKYRTEMEKKFEEMSKRLEKLESKENKNDDKIKDLKIGNPVSALQSVQTTSTPIKTEENNSITDDLKVEILTGEELLKTDMMKGLAVMSKNNYQG